jgi:hypothetical protein
LTSVPDTLRHLRRRRRIYVSAGNISAFFLGIGLALTKPKKRTTPPVFAFELAAMRKQALAAFFSSGLRGARAKPLICKEMAEKQAFSAALRAQGGRPGAKI